MKKIFYVLIVPLVALHSCVDQASSNIDYTLFNQTDKDVKVLGFSNQLDPNTNGKADPININPNSNYKITRVTGIDNDTGKRFYSIWGVDSVRVIFNNVKVKIYTRNPPNLSSILDGDDNHQHFIIEEDYNTAEDCNGNCD